MVLLNQGEMLWQMAMNWKITPGRLAEWLYSWMKNALVPEKRMIYIYDGLFPKPLDAFSRGLHKKQPWSGFPGAEKIGELRLKKTPAPTWYRRLAKEAEIKTWAKVEKFSDWWGKLQETMDLKRFLPSLGWQRGNPADFPSSNAGFWVWIASFSFGSIWNCE